MKRAVLVVALALIAGAAAAQPYPSKPVRVVIPWPPGGSTDVVGRIVLQKVGEYAGQQFIIDNRAGAAGRPYDHGAFDESCRQRASLQKTPL